MNKKTIQYYTREVYGNKLSYIVNEGDAAIIQQLTGKKTIDSKTRELLRDLTAGIVSFEQVIAP